MCRMLGLPTSNARAYQGGECLCALAYLKGGMGSGGSGPIRSDLAVSTWVGQDAIFEGLDSNLWWVDGVHVVPLLCRKVEAEGPAVGRRRMLLHGHACGMAPTPRAPQGRTRQVQAPSTWWPRTALDTRPPSQTVPWCVGV